MLLLDVIPSFCCGGQPWVHGCVDGVIPLVAEAKKLNLVAQRHILGEMGVLPSLVIGQLGADSDAAESTNSHPNHTVFDRGKHATLSDLELDGIWFVSGAIASLPAGKKAVVVNQRDSALLREISVATSQFLHPDAFRESH